MAAFESPYYEASKIEIDSSDKIYITLKGGASPVNRVSEDGGTTWTELATSFPTGADPWVDGSGNIYKTTGAYSLSRSTDGGTTFNPVQDFITTTYDGRTGSSIQFFDDGSAALALLEETGAAYSNTWITSIYYSPDALTGWTQVKQYKFLTYDSWSVYPQKMCGGKIGEKTYLMNKVDSSGGAPYSYGGMILSTTDGATWTAEYPNLGDDFCSQSYSGSWSYALDCAFDSAGNLYFVGSGCGAAVVGAYRK